MSEEYIPQYYLTEPDAFDHFGISESDQKTMPDEERKRFKSWVLEANNKVETELFPDSDAIPLTANTPIFTYARSAALNWVVYKKRDLSGAKNALSAKNDYDRDIKLAKTYLQMTPTKKGEPIVAAVVTDSLENLQVPYSQTMGYPQDLLF